MSTRFPPRSLVFTASLVPVSLTGCLILVVSNSALAQEPGQPCAAGLLVDVPRARQLNTFEDERDVPGAAALAKIRLNVLLRDEVTITETQLVSPPLENPGEKERLCESFQTANRVLYTTTEGGHRLAEVHFYWDQVADYAEQVDGNIDIYWGRYGNQGFPSPNVDPGGTAEESVMYMYDDGIGCPIVDFDGETSTQGCPLVDIDDLSEALECQLVSSDIRRNFCAPPGAALPIRRTPFYAGWVVGHELMHYLYRFRDEYSETPAAPICLGERVPSTDPVSSLVRGIEGTSIMANHGRRFLCDSLSHRDEFVFGTTTLSNVTADCNAWAHVKTVYPELAEKHPNDGTYVAVDMTDLPPVLCQFHFAPENDLMLVVDRSGSMGVSENAGTDLNAWENARDAAIGLYNASEANVASVGLYTYNHDLAKTIPYDVRIAPLAANDPRIAGIAADGLTDICEAIRTAAQDIRASAPQAGFGAIVLLSDGLPTVTECDTTEEVLDAAEEACVGDVPIRIDTLAHGEADYELLATVSQRCEGSAFSTSDGAQSLIVEPEQFRYELTRLGYNARAWQETIHARRLLEVEQEEAFVVPAGTGELEVAWVGDGFEWALVGDGTVTCDYHDLAFELEGPSGQLVLPPDPTTAEGDAQRDVQHVRIRVNAPEAGTWTMRLSGSGWEPACIAPDGGLRDPDTDYRPSTLWLSQLHHANLSTSVSTAGGPLHPRDAPVEVRASLVFPRPYKTTDLTVLARVEHAGFVFPLELRDNGTAGDDQAEDGIYGGLFNAAGANLEEGSYTVTVDFRAEAGVARSVNYADDPVEAAGGGPSLVPLPAVGDAEVSARTSFVLRNCCVAGSASCAACPAPDACTISEFETLSRGSTNVDLVVRTQGFPTGSHGVRVGLGGRVHARNVRSTYDDVTGEGIITFDASVDPNAELGPRRFSIQYGVRRCDGTPDQVDVCDPSGTPVLEAEDVEVVTCAPQEVTLTLPAPTTTDACGHPGTLLLDAWIERVNGVTVSPVVPIDPDDPVATLPPGDSEIVWHALDPSTGATHSIVQVVTITATGDAAACCGTGRTLVEGTAGPDAISRQGATSYCVLAFAGTDSVATDLGSDVLVGGAGNDSMYSGAGSDVCLGNEGADSIEVDGGSSNSLYGGAGNDALDSWNGASDLIYGGPGQDNINSGPGNDTVVPGPERDVVSLGSGDDTLVVFDACELGSGEILSGGSGFDVLVLPVPASQLGSLGVIATGFERVDLVTNRKYLSECFSP